jgi:hypothetical protein
MSRKNLNEARELKKQFDLKAYEIKRTGCCPLCQTQVSEEREKHVRAEIVKSAKDPNYVPKTFSESGKKEI